MNDQQTDLVGAEPAADPKPAKKAAKPALDTVVNCNPAGGHITDLDGKKIPVGGTCELPVSACERLVLAGTARYPARAET